MGFIDTNAWVNTNLFGHIVNDADMTVYDYYFAFVVLNHTYSIYLRVHFFSKTIFV